ncbi:LolA-like outer membrane lipoprotein chaperone [bacterium]|nr:LolA-like outer membrane lipoprotein chaperone [bacterium]MBU1990000.1 LolA-like outer membrane lipoprotein chaperone [bacterium]
MKLLFISVLFLSSLFASLDSIHSFEADFTQSVTDDKNKTLTYNGRILASKPQNAIWSYTHPIQKDVYIHANTLTIIEPEIEQVIIKTIESKLDFFKMIKDAKKIDENSYIAIFQDSKYTITTKDKLIQSISYKDEFENQVKIEFKEQKQNQGINKKLFTPNIPIDFDIIRE